MVDDPPMPCCLRYLIFTTPEKKDSGVGKVRVLLDEISQGWAEEIRGMRRVRDIWTLQDSYARDVSI